MDAGRPVTEILVEGELSPFEHEALYRFPQETSPARTAFLL